MSPYASSSGAAEISWHARLAGEGGGAENDRLSWPGVVAMGDRTQKELTQRRRDAEARRIRNPTVPQARPAGLHTLPRCGIPNCRWCWYQTVSLPRRTRRFFGQGRLCTATRGSHMGKIALRSVFPPVQETDRSKRREKGLTQRRGDAENPQSAIRNPKLALLVSPQPPKGATLR